ncbi:hypothetical protein ACH4GK_01645 [Streptomyces rimosus]|uniref:hypothetical protein n=1 Tax=Streptomyces rimosus TaxID=1927 RepID=UPI0004CB7BC7|nr:hypothetical protein [Streptomyces rimosus]
MNRYLEPVLAVCREVYQRELRAALPPSWARVPATWHFPATRTGTRTGAAGYAGYANEVLRYGPAGTEPGGPARIL